MSDEVSATSGTSPTAGSCFHSRAEERVVGGEVHVGRVWRELQLRLSRQPREVLRFGGGRHIHLADALRLLERLLRPAAGDDVIRGRCPARAGSSAPWRTAATPRPGETALCASRARCRACAAASVSARIASNVFERWLISRIDMPDAGQRHEIALRFFQDRTRAGPQGPRRNCGCVELVVCHSSL